MLNPAFLVEQFTNASAPAAPSQTFLEKIFVDVDALPNDGYGFCQLAFLGLAYAFILMQGANLIKDGSEMLLLIPSWAGIVGPIVLPVLGAVPDGAIVLFSGMGPDAQQQLDVGMGALAGSTIMLLTVPWFLSCLAGRVNMDAAGNGNYVRPRGAGSEWAKLSPSGRLAGTGVNVNASIRRAAVLMALTLIPYFVIQIPAAVARCSLDDDESDCKTPIAAAIAAGVLTVILFLVYLWDQKRQADVDIVVGAKTEKSRRNAVEKGIMSLSAMFQTELFESHGSTRQSQSPGAPMDQPRAQSAFSRVSALSGVLIEGSEENSALRRFLRPYFKRYDRDNNGEIDKGELRSLLESLNEKPNQEDLDMLMDAIDNDKSGGISFDEFVAAMTQVLRAKREGEDRPFMVIGRASMSIAADKAHQQQHAQLNDADNTRASRTDASQHEGKDDDDEEEEEDEEIPEDLVDLSPEEQRKRILQRACVKMALGTFLVVFFSDPMVDVLSKLGTMTNIAPFYVSFVLAPLVSNGSELIAAYFYAGKKTEKSMTIALATLVGSSCMNNTFCLAIFLFLVAAQDLKWVYTAEVTSIIVVELIMLALIFTAGRTLRTWTSFLVILMFPLSIVLVWILENVAKLD
jgi:Ca2+/Na+ antiporter